MNPANIAEKDEIIDKIYKLIKEGEGKDKCQRGEAINILENAYSLYDDLLQRKGKLYLNEHCPDIHAKLKGLVDKLIESHS